MKARWVVIIVLGLAPAVGTPAAAAPPAATDTTCQAAGELAVDGAEGSVVTAEPGLCVRYTFAGQTGQDLSIGLHIPLPDGTWRGYASRATVLDPDGAVVATLIDGPARLVTYDRVGQEKDLHFSGTAQQFVAVRVTDFDLATRQAGAAPGLWIEVYRPQSGAVAYRGVAFGPGDFIVGPLRETGQFTVRTWPLDGSLGRASIGVVGASER